MFFSFTSNEIPRRNKLRWTTSKVAPFSKFIRFKIQYPPYFIYSLSLPIYLSIFIHHKGKIELNLKEKNQFSYKVTLFLPATT